MGGVVPGPAGALQDDLRDRACVSHTEWWGIVAVRVSGTPGLLAKAESLSSSVRLDGGSGNGGTQGIMDRSCDMVTPATVYPHTLHHRLQIKDTEDKTNGQRTY
eukprot:272350-Chlamydomonas_euryale.AAC.1